MKKNYTIVFSVIAALIVLCAFIGCNSGGDDDSGPPSRTIGSAEDVAKIGTSGYPLNGNYELTDDITLPADWTPIGETQPFTGTFDGGRHSITISRFSSGGVNISSVPGPKDFLAGMKESYGTDGGFARGLFAYTKNAVVKNLDITVNLSSSPFVITSTAQQVQFFGIVAAAATNTAFTNINISGGTLEVNAASADALALGGIAGLLLEGNSVTDCTVDVKLKTVLGNTVSYIGGLAGILWENSRMTGCSMVKDVEVSGGSEIKSIGGLAGEAGGTITNSSVSGNVRVVSEGDRSRVGGLVGRHDGIIENCSVTGNVSTESAADSNVRIEVGGLVGLFKQDEGILSAVVQRSYSTGTVTGSATNNGDVRVGGIVATTDDYARITNCYSTGNISGTASDNVDVGGIVGRGSAGSDEAVGNCTIERCYASGNISAAGAGVGDKSAGGIVGNTYVEPGSSGSITDCAALSVSVTCSGSTAKRIVGAANFSLNNNIANVGMLVNSGTVSSIDDADQNGADVSLPVSQSNFQSTLGWDFSNVWKWNGTLPVLKWQP
jgi:hypothetical protein